MRREDKKFGAHTPASVLEGLSLVSDAGGSLWRASYLLTTSLTDRTRTANFGVINGAPGMNRDLHRRTTKDAGAMRCRYLPLAS